MKRGSARDLAHKPGDGAPPAPCRRRPRSRGRIARGSTVAPDLWLAARNPPARGASAGFWLPVGLGAGVAVYFALPVEPPVWLGASACSLLPLLFWLWWRLSAQRFPAPPRPARRSGPSAGLRGGELRTHLVEAPMLERRGAYELEATVLLVEDRTRGQRLLLGVATIEGLERHATPAQIRVSTRSAEPASAGRSRRDARAAHAAVAAGRAGRVRLRPAAYFQRLGAVGYALSEPQLISAPSSGAGRSAWRRYARASRSRSPAAVPGAAGAIGVALLTGLRGALPDSIWDQWAIAGIAHSSPSPLHLAFVAAPCSSPSDRSCACPAARPASAHQEARGAGRPVRLLRLSADLRSTGADPARLRHDRDRAGRDHGRPQSLLDAAGGVGGDRGAAPAAGKPARRILPGCLSAPWSP